MESIIVWIAFAILVTADGPQIINSDTVHTTKEACVAQNAEGEAQIRKHPQFGAILALGTGCAEIKVTEVERKAPAKKVAPTKQSGQQSDLEKPVSETQASPFRSTADHA